MNARAPRIIMLKSTHHMHFNKWQSIECAARQVRLFCDFKMGQGFLNKQRCTHGNQLMQRAKLFVHIFGLVLCKYNIMAHKKSVIGPFHIAGRPSDAKRAMHSSGMSNRLNFSLLRNPSVTQNAPALYMQASPIRAKRPAHRCSTSSNARAMGVLYMRERTRIKILSFNDPKQSEFYREEQYLNARPKWDTHIQLNNFV